MESSLIKNAVIVTNNEHGDVFQGDIHVNGNRISRIGPNIDDPADNIFDASGLIAIPGFIQTHVHLCQALFRNLADDLPLLDWLYQRILPFEAFHTEHSMQTSARLGLAELIKSGTTTIMDFGSVHHQDVIFEEMAASGIRAVAGKTMMDNADVPAGLKENSRTSIQESIRLLKEWHGYDNGRIRYAFTPRFALSSSETLLREVGEAASEYDAIVHSHAAENKDETDEVRHRFGMGNIMLFDHFNLTENHLCLAHCIWTEEEERRILEEKNINVLHCPSANLKLGSGIAPVPDYLRRGITVSLGADGAPCNNNLSVFNEMRLASLIQKPFYGPDQMNARETFRLATTQGAKTLGLTDEIGSLETGKLADITFLKSDSIHAIPHDGIISKIVYSMDASDVNSVMIGGRWVLKDKELLTLHEESIVTSVQNEIKKLPEMLA